MEEARITELHFYLFIFDTFRLSMFQLVVWIPALNALTIVNWTASSLSDKYVQWEYLANRVFLRCSATLKISSYSSL